MYKYDTHLHTMQASFCANVPGKFQAEAYKEAGYDGIIITDHFFRGNTCISRELPWEERINQFYSGYEDAKKRGDKIGIKVFFGWEETYAGTDFLIYGLDKEWLLEHPECEYWTIQEQYQEVSAAGGLVVHAHPFRKRDYIPKIRLFPNLIHAVEVYNAGNDEEENRRALTYAQQYDLPMTSGSDNHTAHVLCSGVATNKPLNSIQDYINLIKYGSDYNLIY